MRWLYVIDSEDVKGDKHRLLKKYFERNKIPVMIYILHDTEEDS